MSSSARRTWCEVVDDSAESSLAPTKASAALAASSSTLARSMAGSNGPSSSAGGFAYAEPPKSSGDGDRQVGLGVSVSEEKDLPRFVDEHRIRIAAPRERVWRSLRRYVDASLANKRDNPFVRLLGTEPRSGFAVSREVPGTLLGLSGRHRFSRYLLEFELADAVDGTTELSARTSADFPGVHGRVYRFLVIGSRGHVLAVRGMLRSIRRSSLRS